MLDTVRDAPRSNKDPKQVSRPHSGAYFE